MTGGVKGVITGQITGVTCGAGTGSTTGAGAGGVTGSTTGNGSPGRITFVPQWLQNADPGGTRFPQREQNEPWGRVVVSMGLGGTGPVSMGLGGTGSVSMIFFIGRAISIFFFTAELLVIRICGGVVTSGSFS